jgi:hypothetical protein
MPDTDTGLDDLLTRQAQKARIKRAEIIRDYDHLSPCEREDFICHELQQLLCLVSIGHITHHEREQLAALLRSPPQKKKQVKTRTRKRR